MPCTFNNKLKIGQSDLDLVYWVYRSLHKMYIAMLSCSWASRPTQCRIKEKGLRVQPPHRNVGKIIAL